MIAKIQLLLAVLTPRARIALLFAPGRVGSMSVAGALRRSHLPTIKAEYLDQEKLYSVQLLRTVLLPLRRPMPVVTLVRDPMDMLLSLFLSKLQRGSLEATTDDLRNRNFSHLREVFITQCAEGRYYEQYVRWFETEFERHLHFLPFPAHHLADKAWVFKHDRYPTLILRTDMPDGAKTNALASFLNHDISTVTRSNTKEDNPLAAQYSEFKQVLRLPRTLVQRLYDTPYVAEFFTEHERTAAVAKWSES